MVAGVAVAEGFGAATLFCKSLILLVIDVTDEL
jgi:hypothetical protein